MRTLIVKPGKKNLVSKKQLEITDAAESARKHITEATKNDGSIGFKHRFVYPSQKPQRPNTGNFIALPATSIEMKPIQEEIIVKPLLTSSNRLLIKKQRQSEQEHFSD